MISDQISLFSNQQPIKTLEIEVPHFPSVIRYTDDFTEKDHSFSNFYLDTWALISNGSQANLKFDRYNLDPCLKKLIKLFAADRVVRYSASSIRLLVDSLVHFNTEEIVAFIESSPESARQFWDSLRAQERPAFAYDGLKSLLKFVAERRLAAWTPLYLPFISASLPLPHHDKFATVRSGDAFISIEEEARLVRWIYEKAANSKCLSDKDLIDAGLIVCNYQFAMRPKQIGLLRRRDCRVMQFDDGGLSVHLNFRMIKQRTASAARTPLPRKIKREWAIIFSEIFTRGDGQPGDAHLFGFVTSASVSKRLNQLIRDILESERSANNIRHSGAMRQVDAGASAEELAEFMGHSSLETGLVYFDASPTQAERVNQALGISETYQRLAILGKDRFISMDDLAELKGEQQVAGVPHGIPIAGIGGCKTGQPACPYNPITACY
jgi:integrase